MRDEQEHRPMKRPNRTTRETFTKTDAGEDIHRAKDADEMFRELEAQEQTRATRSAPQLHLTRDEWDKVRQLLENMREGADWGAEYGESEQAAVDAGRLTEVIESIERGEPFGRAELLSQQPNA